MVLEARKAAFKSQSSSNPLVGADDPYSDVPSLQHPTENLKGYDVVEEVEQEAVWFNDEGLVAGLEEFRVGNIPSVYYVPHFLSSEQHDDLITHVSWRTSQSWLCKEHSHNPFHLCTDLFNPKWKMDTTQTTPLANVGYIPHHSFKLFPFCAVLMSAILNWCRGPAACWGYDARADAWMAHCIGTLSHTEQSLSQALQSCAHQWVPARPGNNGTSLSPPFESICQRASPSLPAPIFLASRRWAVVHSSCGHSQSSEFGGDGHLCQTRHATEQSLFSALRTR